VLSVEHIRAEDPIRSARTAVFPAWQTELNVGTDYRVRDLISCAEAFDGAGYVRPALREALQDVAQPKNGQQAIDPMKLSHWLRNNRNAVAAGHKLLENKVPARSTYRLARQ